MCITTVCYPGCNAIKFEINLIFLMKPFFYMTKTSRHKLEYLENEKSFCCEIKSNFSTFLKGFQLPKLVLDMRVRL